MTEFAKKTGDYTSLSATDIKVIALTYQLEKEHVGTAHLKDAPQVPKTIDASRGQPLDHPKSIAGFYVPGADEDSEDDNNEDGESAENENDVGQPEEKNETEIMQQEEKHGSPRMKNNEEEEFSGLELSGSADESDYLTAISDIDEPEPHDLASKFETLNCNHEELKVEGAHEVDDILVPVKTDFESNEDSGDGGSEEEDGDSDDGGWITPSRFFTSFTFLASFERCY